MVRCIVYNYINSDIFQRSLCILSKLRLFQTYRISQPADRQFLSVFVYISIAISVCPSRFFKKLLGSVRIIGNSFYCIISIRKAARECCFCRHSTTFHNYRTETFLIDSHLYSLADILILHDLRIHVELSEEATACCTGIDRIIRISVKQCIIVILKPISSLNISCLQGSCQRTSVCK